MDPQETLKRLQQAYSAVAGSLKSRDRDAVGAALEELTLAADDLRDYIGVGGFLPHWDA